MAKASEGEQDESQASKIKRKEERKTVAPRGFGFFGKRKKIVWLTNSVIDL